MVDRTSSQYRCPVCGYPGLYQPAWEGASSSLEICPSCGVQFGYHDSVPDEDKRRQRHQQLRREWKSQGCRWSDVTTSPPADWDPLSQLRSVEEA